MKLADLVQLPTEWLRGTGPMNDVVISSRIRLARNLAGMPFLTRCSDEQQREVETRLRNDIRQAHLAEEVLYVDIPSTDELDRELLVERHLISRQHAEGDKPRGVAFSSNEGLAIMVNEEDHLRVQVLRSGLELDGATDEIARVEALLEDRMNFAFHRRYGYLTACPTNVGTGLRISVMMHLPALKMTGEIEKVFRAARDMRLAIRGLYGEGTEATGDFFQISNQTTLGKDEKQIVEDFRAEMLPNIIDYERKARQIMLTDRGIDIDDKVDRALAVLHAAKLISSEETTYLLSLVRLGVWVGRCNEMDIPTVNKLFLLTQPAHLQKMYKRVMEPRERAQARATYIRECLEAT